MSDRRSDFEPGVGGIGAVPDPNFETGPDHAKRKVNEALDAAESLAARAAGPETAQRLRERAGGVVDRGEDLYYGVLDSLDKQVQNAPYRSLGVALGIGIALGFLLAGNRRVVIYRQR